MFSLRKKHASIIKTLLIVLVVLGIFGLIANFTSKELLISINKDVLKQDSVNKNLVVEKIDVEKNMFGSYDLKGTVKNQSNDKYTYIEISYDLYDEDNNLVGTLIENNVGIQPEGTWNFRLKNLKNIKYTTFKLKKLIAN